MFFIKKYVIVVFRNLINVDHDLGETDEMYFLFVFSPKLHTCAFNCRAVSERYFVPITMEAQV